jgi:aldehyde dehydrogenase (NAD+)
LQEPLGVCEAIIPFNSPIVTFGMKVAPAQATGNSVIVKVSEFNPFSAMYLGELATQAGIPDGTINILAEAAEAGQALSLHMAIRKISFTGSPITGRRV